MRKLLIGSGYVVNQAIFGVWYRDDRRSEFVDVNAMTGQEEKLYHGQVSTIGIDLKAFSVEKQKINVVQLKQH